MAAEDDMWLLLLLLLLLLSLRSLLSIRHRSEMGIIRTRLRRRRHECHGVMRLIAHHPRIVVLCSKLLSLQCLIVALRLSLCLSLCVRLLLCGQGVLVLVPHGRHTGGVVRIEWRGTRRWTDVGRG